MHFDKQSNSFPLLLLICTFDNYYEAKRHNTYIEKTY